MDKEKCLFCDNNIKYVHGEYVLKTRIPGKESVLVEGVRYKQCTVCSYEELTDGGKSMIEAIRTHYTNTHSKETERRNKEAEKKPFISFLKKFGVFD